MTGVGGTGVVTIGAIIGMAAHLEGKGCGIIDMAGLAQKGGAVFAHVKIAQDPDDIHAIRVAAGEADLVLGCDFVVAGTKKVLAAATAGETAFVVNTSEVYPGDFTRNADFRLPSVRIRRAIEEAAGGPAHFIDATGIASALLGGSVAANMFLLGHAWQKGFLPLSWKSIFRAIELNGEAVELNQNAFTWGRKAAVDLPSVEALVAPLRRTTQARQLSESFDELVSRRVAFLTSYQDAAYARRYHARVMRMAEVEKARAAGRSGLAEAMAKGLFKLMAIKDEYEVARLYTDGAFARQLAATFEGDVTLEFHLAPPILGRRDAQGRPRKTTFGPWMMTVFRGLAALRGLRGGVFDLFGYLPERRMERRLLADYETLLDEISGALTPDNHATAVALAALPDKIRGFGHVKERHVAAAKAEEAALIEVFRHGEHAVRIAAE